MTAIKQIILLCICLVYPLFIGTTTITAEELLEVRALLMPQSEATMSSQMAGKISNLPLRNGEYFKEGDLLVQFDCSRHLAQLKRAEAELAKAEAIYRSNTMLFEMNSSSHLDVQISEANVKATEAEAGIVKAMLEYCDIKAPFDGRVIKVLVNAHESVVEGQELVEIVDTHTPYVQMLVPSDCISWIESKPTFSVSIDETGEAYPAKITRVAGKVDAVSQTIEVYGSFLKNHEELLSGMSGVASFDEMTLNKTVTHHTD